MKTNNKFISIFCFNAKTVVRMIENKNITINFNKIEVPFASLFSTPLSNCLTL